MTASIRVGPPPARALAYGTNGAHAALFGVGYAANVLLQLRALISDIDPNPLVLSIARTPSAKVPWTAA